MAYKSLKITGNMKNAICPICEQDNIKLKVNSPKLKVYRCVDCDLYFVNSHSGMTETDYYVDFSLDKYISYYKDFRIRYFVKNWQLIKNIKPSGKALDFGASFGWFIECAPKSWKVVGIEPSKKAVSYAKAKGIQIIHGDQRMLKNVASSYDLITLWNVFEHVSNPTELLKIFNKALKLNGLLIISVPNRHGLISNIAYFASGLKIYKPISVLFQVGNPSPHLFHYTENNVKDLLLKSGFKYLTTYKQPIIDIKNIDKRILLEKKSNLPKLITTRIGIRLFYYLSTMLNKHDEIVIYAKKNR